jgi:hypothetical protein
LAKLHAQDKTKLDIKIADASVKYFKLPTEEDQPVNLPKYENELELILNKIALKSIVLNAPKLSEKDYAVKF